MAVMLLSIVLRAISFCTGQTLMGCTSGERVVGGTCQPCQPDTFMLDYQHTNTACWPCFTDYTIKNKKAMTIKTACNSTHQAEIGCIPGYFHVPDIHSITSPGECDRCQHCSDDDARPHEVRNCSGTHDAVCCESPEMVAVVVEGGFQCQCLGVGCTDSKGPDVTEKINWETLPSSGTTTTSCINTSTISTITNDENVAINIWTVWIIVIIVTVILVVVIVYVIKKPKMSTLIVNFKRIKTKEGKNIDVNTDTHEADVPLNLV